MMADEPTSPGYQDLRLLTHFSLPEKTPSELEVATKGFSHKAGRFLHPPVRLLGIPAMRKLADEILEWDNRKCFEHMATYATTPIDRSIDPETFENSHGMRFWQADVLAMLGDKYNVSNWAEASRLFRQSGEEIMELCKAALNRERRQASSLLTAIADIEEQAYRLLEDE